MIRLETNWLQSTAYITWYMIDGSIITFDLLDPKKPLPRFRSLTLMEVENEEAQKDRT